MTWPSRVKYFSPLSDEMLGDPEGTRMDLTLMLTLDAMREEVGLPFVITSGFRELSHQEQLVSQGLTEGLGSAHIGGQGVDGYFAGLPLLASFVYACRWPWKGIGLYPYVSNNWPVIHLDVMERGKGRTAMWIRNRTKQYVYAPGPRFVEELQMLVAAERWER